MEMQVYVSVAPFLHILIHWNLIRTYYNLAIYDRRALQDKRQQITSQEFNNLAFYDKRTLQDKRQKRLLHTGCIRQLIK